MGCLVWTISIYSIPGHKEWRFLHPLLPLCHVFASKSLVDAYDSDQSTRISSTKGTRPCVPIRNGHMWFILLTVPASIFVVFFYSSAQIRVMSYLRSLPSDELRSVGFLMPCHSTPWQAYLHRPDLTQPGKLWALGCEPPLGYVHIISSTKCRLKSNLFSGQGLATYRDQTDIFFDSPVEYIQNNFPAEVDTNFPPSSLPNTRPGATIQVTNNSTGPWKHEWPQVLVMFGVLLEDQDVRALLKSRGYSEVWSSGWRWEGEGKRKGGVKVLRHH
jgi:GPI mannosyltransferase 3